MTVTLWAGLGSYSEQYHAEDTFMSETNKCISFKYDCFNIMSQHRDCLQMAVALWHAIVNTMHVAM